LGGALADTEHTRAADIITVENSRLLTDSGCDAPAQFVDTLV
jgi:hypothetical protein